MKYKPVKSRELTTGELLEIQERIEKELKTKRKATIKEVREYIKHYIEKAKEDWEESYLDKFDPDFLIIPYKVPYFGIFSIIEGSAILDYCQDFNDKLIAEMKRRGYKAHWCDEDIEFYK